MKARIPIVAGLTVLIAVGIGVYLGRTAIGSGRTDAGLATHVRRQGMLVMPANNNLYNLDSLAPDWGEVTAELVTGVQNITLSPNGPEPPYLQIIGAVARLPHGVPWTAAACQNAAYGNDPHDYHGYRVRVGQALCVGTFNSDEKTDGCHLALLDVEALSAQSLTLKVTVWNLRNRAHSPDVSDWC